ncbi:hypothetical protein P879_00318 [Paragonimus westermani]|uniref:JmjC domain-containing protein n=1 Tax=Paragonimus westermani TaxID=34504 RepID=A0A8T0DXT3_9TREM|nr:hypothetical protein P879_00318 [Paragonimus westermani]
MAVGVAQTMPPNHFIEEIDVNDPEYVRQMLRPPVIKEDVKLMQQRARVSLILRSPFFRRELEKIVASQMKDGCLNANVAALMQILDYFTPHTKFGSSNFTRSATMPVLPINDLKGAHPPNYQKGERLVRCKLASVYRLVDIFGWNKGINCHITARVTRDASEYLISPLGLLYHEITASSLAKVALDGSIVDPGTAGLGIDRQGWLLHAAVHEARPDVRCIIHLNTPATIAVSCTKSGLLPISQEAMILGEACIYDPTTLLAGTTHGDLEMNATQRKERRYTEERAAVATALSAHSQDCMILMVRNHGILAMGQSIEEAWFVAFTAIVACEAQLRVASLGEEELVLPVKEAQQAAHYVGRTPAAVQLRPGENVGSSGWRRGELEFEALMRRLDAAGYHTGHVYRLGQVRATAGTASTIRRQHLEDIPDDVAVTEPMTPREAAAFVRKTASLGRGLRGLKEVEIPPTTSSFASAYYGDDESRAAAAAEARAKTMSLSRTHWLNTPNVYSRQDIEEIGTPNPKKIPHWTEDLEDAKRRTGGLAVPIDNPNQFAPQGADPHEFRRRQRKVKENYYKDTKNAGPRSRILEGLDLEDGELTDGTTSPIVSPRGTLLRVDPSNPPTLEPGHIVVVGAASKGIISRDQRHNVGIFQSVYSPNPFDRVTDDDLERYRENVDRKIKGLPSLEDEEAAARIEEARKAAEVARQAMEIAASQPMKFRFRLKTASLKTEQREQCETVVMGTDNSNTLADLPSSLLCSSATSTCFSEINKLRSTRRSISSSRLGLEKELDSDYAHVTFPSISLDTLSNSAAPVPETINEEVVSSETVQSHCFKPLVRRHSAFRYWYWPRTKLRSTPISVITPFGKIKCVQKPTISESSRFHWLRRRKTITGLVAATSLCNQSPDFSLRNTIQPLSLSEVFIGMNSQLDRVEELSSAWPSGVLIRFHHSLDSRVSPCASGDSTNMPGKSLDTDTSRAGQSGTSGAEASHDDTEKESTWTARVSCCYHMLAFPVLTSPISLDEFYLKHVDEEFYQLPDLFTSDWMNEFWTVRRDVQDDFRFVYLGVRNTWTPLHADVYQSYSWSVNICGEKRWWFFPPGEEKKLCAFNNGRMPMDVRNLPLESTGAAYFLIVQHPGQAVFVPSGWYHQVVNVTNCLSINHNWFNATNVKWVWDHLQSQLASVEASTEDVRDTPGWHEQCQVCLRALAGINFWEFFILLKYILLTRWPNRNICLPLSSTPQSAQCDGDPDELTRLERVIDAELLDCLQNDTDTIRSLLQNPCSWQDGIQGSGVELVEHKLPQWIRLHDFISVLQIIPLFLKHPVVERLKSISENPLNKYLTVL